MLPPIDLTYVSEAFSRIAAEVGRAAEDSPEGSALALEARLATRGMIDLLDALADIAADAAVSFRPTVRTRLGAEPDALLDHGLSLVGELAAVAGRAGLAQGARDAEQLALPFACWMLRRGAELERPGAVVEAACALAQTLTDTEELAALHGLMGELVEGFGPRSAETDPSDPAHPWRTLLLARARVATRSQKPNLMVEAFQGICEQIPEQAPDLLRECMGQVEAQDAPAQVREVMERYSRLWCGAQRLH